MTDTTTTDQFAQAVALLAPGLDVDTDGCDCGPRFESVMNQITYAGIWCYSNQSGIWFAVELRELKEHAWLEDGVMLDGRSHVVLYADFATALAQVTKIVSALTDTSPV